MNFIDKFLNNITMYRLVLYALIVFLLIGVIESTFRILSFSPIWLIISTIFLVAVSWLTNKLFAKLFRAETNLESFFISSLILACIVGPATSLNSLLFLGMAAIWTIASKYILAINKKHIFNPVAIGVWIAGISLGQYATWWVGSPSMAPFVLIAGLLITRKLRREYMIISFFAAVLLTVTLFTISNPIALATALKTAFLATPIFFFAFVMFTEPLTTPPTKILQMGYGLLVGILFSPQFHIGSFRTGIEGALLIGNMFSYLVSPKIKAYLLLRERKEVASETFDFVFDQPRNLSFLPGQYMEWTLNHSGVDSRGSRRYFTIASSPTEPNLRIGVKIGPKASSYKNTLYNLGGKKQIVASQPSGDFVLPKNQKEKLVFIGGGIGITPFRSMVKYLLDKKEKRDVIVFYTAKTPNEFAYKKLLDEAQGKLGIKVIYAITDKDNVFSDWKGYRGRVDSLVIINEVPDYKERTFFLSGPNNMVKGSGEILKSMGVSESKIHKDFFPGYV